MKNLDVKDLSIQLHNILVTVTSYPDYEMDRKILLDYQWYSNSPDKEVDYVVIEGSHCSCYDFDETQWEATGYTEEELKKLANAPYNKTNKFWELVREQIH